MAHCCSTAKEEFKNYHRVKSRQSVKPLPYSAVHRALEKLVRGEISRSDCQVILPRAAVSGAASSWNALHYLIHEASEKLKRSEGEEKTPNKVPLEESENRPVVIECVPDTILRLSRHYQQMASTLATDQPSMDMNPARPNEHYSHPPLYSALISRVSFIKALIPAIHGRTNSATQTTASAFRRDTSTQVYLPKDSGCNTGCSRSAQCYSSDGSAFAGEGRPVRF